MDPSSVHSNIVVVDVPDAPAVVAAVREHDVLVSAVGPRALRMVTHLDVSRDQTETGAIPVIQHRRVPSVTAVLRKVLR